MRRIFDVVIGRSNEAQDIDFDFSRVDISKLWTIYDRYLQETLRVQGPDSIWVRHGFGAFIETQGHDWSVHDGKLYYYSCVDEIGTPTMILVEYKNKN